MIIKATSYNQLPMEPKTQYCRQCKCTLPTYLFDDKVPYCIMCVRNFDEFKAPQQKPNPTCSKVKPMKQPNSDLIQPQNKNYIGQKKKEIEN